MFIVVCNYGLNSVKSMKGSAARCRRSHIKALPPVRAALALPDSRGVHLGLRLVLECPVLGI